MGKRKMPFGGRNWLTNFLRAAVRRVNKLSPGLACLQGNQIPNSNSQLYSLLPGNWFKGCPGSSAGRICTGSFVAALGDAAVLPRQ